MTIDRSGATDPQESAAEEDAAEGTPVAEAPEKSAGGSGPTAEPAKKARAKKNQPAGDEASPSEEPTTREHANRTLEVLAARRETERLRSEVSRLWEEAATEAETMVAQAQELAAQLVEEAQTEAGLMSEAAKAHAAALTSGAEQDALRMRKQVEEEVTATRLRGEAAHRVQMAEARKEARDAVESVSGVLDDLKAQLDTSRQAIDAVETRLRELAETLQLEPEVPAAPPQSAEPPPPSLPSLADRAVEPAAAPRGGAVVIETRQTLGSRTRSERGHPRVVRPTEKAAVAPALSGSAQPDLTGSEPARTRGGKPAAEPAEGRPLGWLFRAP